jgi:hypothetical protein
MAATPGTISHGFSPDDDVYVIYTRNGCDAAVLAGVVVQVRANIVALGSPSPTTTVKYDIRLANENGTTEFLEVDVFGTLNEAITEYESRLTP